MSSFDQEPIVFSCLLARHFGVNETLVLQQLHFWLRQNVNKPTHQREGKTWCRKTYEQWQQNDFYFWSVRTVTRIFAELIARGWLSAENSIPKATIGPAGTRSTTRWWKRLFAVKL